MAARGQHPGGTTIPCFLLQASSRTGASIGEVPSRFWSRDGVDSCSNESGDHDPISFVSRDSPPPSSPGWPQGSGGRVRTNMFVRDMDLDVPVNDGRRLEVVVDGLPLHGGAQLAVDTTLVCALHKDGRPRRGAASHDGVALRAAKRKKVATYPELVGLHSRAKLVVLGVEVGG